MSVVRRPIGWSSASARGDGDRNDQLVPSPGHIDLRLVHGRTEHPLYQLVRQRGPITDHMLVIEFDDPGVQAFSFTFG
jgi:hypothetical protein